MDPQVQMNASPSTTSALFDKRGSGRRTKSVEAASAAAAAERSRGACILGAVEVISEQLSRAMAMDFDPRLSRRQAADLPGRGG